jgi:hypothetical protein
MPGVIRCVMAGVVDVDEMKDFVASHNRAVDEMRGADYRVWVDLRGLETLRPEATEVMEQAKRYSSKHPNFRGSAVLVSRATILLQHQRTSISGGVIDSELLSEDEEECKRHLASVNRTRSGPKTGRARSHPRASVRARADARKGATGSLSRTDTAELGPAGAEAWRRSSKSAAWAKPSTT